MSAKISIFQVYYNNDTKQHLDPAFIPFDNTTNPCPEEREFYVYRKYFEENGYDVGNDYIGFMSWKFGNKAQISGAEFLSFIAENPGYDVYFINPFPEISFFQSPWEEAEMCHPGIVERTRKLFPEISDQLLSIKNTTLNTLRCNFFVGNQRFWEKYFKDFCLPAYQKLNSFRGEAYNQYFCQADIRSDRQDLGYFPFIFERLFSSFLALNKEIKYLGYQYSENQLKTKVTADEKTCLTEQQVQRYIEMLKKDQNKIL